MINIRSVLAQFQCVWIRIILALLTAPIVWATVSSAMLFVGLVPTNSMVIMAMWNIAIITVVRYTAYGFGRLYAVVVVLGYTVIGFANTGYLMYTTDMVASDLVRIVYLLYVPGFAAIVAVVAFGNFHRFVMAVGVVVYFSTYSIGNYM